MDRPIVTRRAVAVRGLRFVRCRFVDCDVVLARPSRLQSIDVLRGAAVLAVMILHIPHREPNWGEPTTLRYWLMLPIEYGGYGVMLFIVISGFCIHSSRLAQEASADSPSTVRWRAFWKRRFVRLYPTYVAALAFTLGVWCYVINLDYVKAQFLPADLLQHLTMTHNLTPDHPLTLNGPAWTLGVEEQLYLMYMAVLWFRRRGSMKSAVVVTFLVTLGWTILLEFVPDVWTVGPVKLGSLNLWPFSFWFGWVLGALAAEIYHGRVRPAPWMSRPRIAVAAILLTTIDHPFVWPHLTGHDTIGTSVLAWTHTTSRVPSEIIGWVHGGILIVASAVPWFVLINHFATRERVAGRSLRIPVRAVAWVGMISYSLYLTHVPVIQAFERLSDFTYRTDPGRVLWRYPLTLACMLLVGWLFFTLIERRFLFSGQKRRAPASAGLIEAEGPVVRSRPL